MKISEQTLNILKNFSTINQSFYTEGNTNIIRSVSPGKTLMSSATIEESFPVEFAIYNLGQFISCISMFEELPELQFEDTYVKIGSGKRSFKYKYTDKSLLQINEVKDDIKLSNPIAEFELLSKQLTTATKALAILALPELSFIADGSEICIQTSDNKNTDTSKYNSILSVTDKTFNAIIESENMKIIPGDYDVSIFNKPPVVQFINKNSSLRYWIALHRSSVFK